MLLYGNIFSAQMINIQGEIIMNTKKSNKISGGIISEDGKITRMSNRDMKELQTSIDELTAQAEIIISTDSRFVNLKKQINGDNDNGRI